jgi:inositol-phosphate transport system substrate-binding protein
MSDERNEMEWPIRIQEEFKMMVKKSILLVMAVSFIFSACSKDSQNADVNKNAGGSATTGVQQIVTIRAQQPWGDMTRLTNLEEAGKELNEQLKAEGKNIEVKVETSKFDGSLDEYRKQFILAYKSKKEMDIITVGHGELAWMAKGGYIRKMDELKQSKAYADTYPALWNAVTWKGNVWGALQDTEVRPIFYRKDALKKLGWTDEQIETLPEKVKKGEFTLADMTAVAKEAVSKGIVQYGIMHRPSAGPEWQMIAYANGAKMYDAEQDKMIFDKPGILKTLQYFQTLTRTEKVTPEAITSMEFKNIHQIMMDGKALFWYGGIWNVFNYQAELGAKYDDIMSKFGFTLIPAAEKGGKPMTLSNPVVYTVSSQTKNPELVMRLLELTAAPKYQAKHAVTTYHLPFTKGGAEAAEFKSNKFLSSVTYYLDYTTFQPVNEEFNKFADTLYKAVQGVELGKQTPDQALKVMETQIKADSGDKVIIKN